VSLKIFFDAAVKDPPERFAAGVWFLRDGSISEKIIQNRVLRSKKNHPASREVKSLLGITAQQLKAVVGQKRLINAGVLWRVDVDNQRCCSAGRRGVDVWRPPVWLTNWISQYSI
jgi:hypothetical protein